MAATVASLPLPPQDTTAMRVDNPAEARKRRREILASHRATPDIAASTANVVLAEGETSPQTKRRKVVADLPALVSPSSPAKAMVSSKANNSKAKKPQMKYDPDVPMTKEEAAVWRREQRRKRNRESAAASRQRQRDRIVELEAEVEEWKVKFDEAMKKIQELEANKTSTSCESDASSVEECSPVIGITQEVQEGPEEDEGINIQSPEELVEEVFKDTTILISPSQSPRSVSPTCATVDFMQVQAVKVVSNIGASQVVSKEEQSEEPQPSKMISRPAVKINSSTGSAPLPLLPDDESLLSPDPCLSLSAANKIAPIDSKLFPRPSDDEAVPAPVTTMLTATDDNEAEFGEFLLDAVDWL